MHSRIQGALTILVLLVTFDSICAYSASSRCNEPINWVDIAVEFIPHVDTPSQFSEVESIFQNIANDFRKIFKIRHRNEVRLIPYCSNGESLTMHRGGKYSCPHRCEEPRYLYRFICVYYTMRHLSCQTQSKTIALDRKYIYPCTERDKNVEWNSAVHPPTSNNFFIFVITTGCHSGFVLSDIVFKIAYIDQFASNSEVGAWTQKCKPNKMSHRPCTPLTRFAAINMCNLNAATDEARMILYHESLHAIGSFKITTTGGYNNLEIICDHSSFDNCGNSTGTTLDEYNGRKYVTLFTPKVLQAARNYYNCPTMKAMVLSESHHGDSAWNHWHPRYVGYEVLNPVSSRTPYVFISPMTIAALEDTGLVNAPNWRQQLHLTNFRELQFGKNKGCDFIDSRCHEWTMKAQNDEFCRARQTSRCVFGNRFLASCVDYSSRGLRCPLAIISQDCHQDHKICVTVKTRRGRTKSKVKGCYSYRCNGRNELMVEVDSTQYVCPHNRNMKYKNNPVYCPEPSVINELCG